MIDGLAALVLNLVALAFMVQAAFPDLHLRKPDQAIDVELVTEPAKGPAGTASEKPEAPSATPEPAGEQADAAPAKSEPPAQPTGPDGTPDRETPYTATLAHAAAKAEPPPASEPDQRPEPAKPAAAAPPSAAAPDATPPVAEAKAAQPPPLDQPSADPTSRLVEVPIAAPPADVPSDHPTTTDVPSDQPTTADAVPKPTETTQPAPPPAGVPPVLSSPVGDDAVPAPPEPVDMRTPAERRRQEENTAKLAAALPFSQTPPTGPTRATLPGTAAGTSQSYRAAVYGNFNKAAELFEEARAKHLKGQTVVAFSLDDGGNLASAAVAVSSGDAEVDALALAAIRRGAPYPPPPPGASRAFAPAIRLGLDE